MNKIASRLSGVAAGAILYSFALPALAQDRPAPATKSDKDAAVKTVETYESHAESQPETMEETFFRLSQDFVMTNDEGSRRLGAVPIWPRGELKIGGVRVVPFLRQAVEWEDNYYLHATTGERKGDEGRKGQWTHVNEAGLLASTALAGGRLTISGSVDSIWNVRYNDTQDTWELSSQLGATYRWPTGVWISGGINYERRHDPADLPDLSNDFGRNNRRAFFDVGFDRDIFFGSKLRFEFGVNTNNAHAQDEAFSDLNRQETQVYGKASYPFLGRDTTRIFVLGRYRWDNRQSESINDGKTFGMNVGLEGSIPLREGEYRGLRGQVSVGFEDSLYSNDTFQKSSDTIVADENRTATHLNVQAALQYTMSPRSSADLRYMHGTEFSFYGNYQVLDRIELNFMHNFTRQLVGRIGVFYEHTDPSGHDAQETIPDSDSAAYSHGAHNPNRSGIGIGLRYAYNEWMDIDFSADVEDRNDHGDKSYRNYRGVLGVTFYLNSLTPKVRSAIGN